MGYKVAVSLLCAGLLLSGAKSFAGDPPTDETGAADAGGAAGVAQAAPAWQALQEIPVVTGQGVGDCSDVTCEAPPPDVVEDDGVVPDYDDTAYYVCGFHTFCLLPSGPYDLAQLPRFYFSGGRRIWYVGNYYLSPRYGGWVGSRRLVTYRLPAYRGGSKGFARTDQLRDSLAAPVAGYGGSPEAPINGYRGGSLTGRRTTRGLVTGAPLPQPLGNRGAFGAGRAVGGPVRIR